MQNTVVFFCLVLLCGCGSHNSSELAEQHAMKATQALNKEDFDSAKAWALKAHELRPTVAEYCVGVAFASAKLNEPVTAKDYYTKALAILDRQSQEDPKRVADCAMVLFCLGRKKDAEATLVSGIKRFPEASHLGKLRENMDEWFDELSEYKVGNAQP